jgi:oxaloacetate decarboxylase gamma subunit
MANELLEQGLTLLLAGMGTVFVFLMILVAAMTLMSRSIMHFLSRAAAADVTEEEVAAISAAIARHRSSK